jgi:NAD(P)-dependent dehydrogenase (short-subunit alcohol dehydrogenase family)
MRLKNKVAIVTGGASGIGRATAVCFAAEGARVAVVDVNQTEGMETVGAIEAAGGEARFVCADVSVEADVAAMTTAVERDFGRLDVLVNCAGIFLAPRIRVDLFEEESWERVIDINLKGAFLTTKHAVQPLERSGGGVVLFIASTAGVTSSSASVAYGASKGGVHGLAFTLAEQLEPANIRVNVVCPNDIATPLKLEAIREIAEREGQAPEEALEAWRAALGEPEGVARVLALLASDDAAYVRGTVFTR